MITRPDEGSVSKFRLLDAQEDRIECGVIISSDPDCTCYYKTHGLHDCSSCGEPRAYAHGLTCEDCAQRLYNSSRRKR